MWGFWLYSVEGRGVNRYAFFLVLYSPSSRLDSARYRLAVLETALSSRIGDSQNYISAFVFSIEVILLSVLILVSRFAWDEWSGFVILYCIVLYYTVLNYSIKTEFVSTIQFVSTSHLNRWLVECNTFHQLTEQVASGVFLWMVETNSVYIEWFQVPFGQGG